MQLTDEQKKLILETEAAVVELLKSKNCHLEGVTILRNGQVDVQIVIAINPPQAEETAAPAEPAEAPAEGFKTA
jgi:predicted DNA binding protein